jgi:thymidylate kinase
MLIIIEGPDRVGKDTLISGLMSSGLLINPIVVHSSKPEEPTKAYYTKYYGDVYTKLDLLSSYDIIMNRSAIGEYVYGPMYRNNHYELNEIVNHNDYVKDFVLVFTLIDKPETLLQREDGESFGTTLEQKTEEVNRFIEVTNYFNGYIINCDGKTPEQVLKEVLNNIADELS